MHGCRRLASQGAACTAQLHRAVTCAKRVPRLWGRQGCLQPWRAGYLPFWSPLLYQVMLPLFCATRAATVVLALAEVAATKMNGQLSAALAGGPALGDGVARGAGGVRSKCTARRAPRAGRVLPD